MTDSEIFNLLFNGGRYSRHFLIKLSHPQLSPILLADNNENISLDGDTFLASTFEYYPPESDGENGELRIISNPSENGVFEFVENADYRYKLEVVGIIAKDGTVQKIKVYRHFYGTVTGDKDNLLDFTLGTDDRKNMTFTPYTYDTDNNRGNA